MEDVLVAPLAGLHRPQHRGEAAVQGGEVGLGQERGHARQGVLGQGLAHDVAQAVAGGRQEAQAQEGRVTEPARGAARACGLMLVFPPLPLTEHLVHDEGNSLCVLSYLQHCCKGVRMDGSS